MGNMCFGEERQFSKLVFTLNYCGISYSPFEFYFTEHNESLQKISQIFKTLVGQYVPNFSKEFKWEMGSIEKNFKKGRYSNMFSPRVGIESQKFINRKQFQELWYKSYNQYLIDSNTKIEKGKEKEHEQQQKQVCLYDFIMYYTLLRFVYGEQPFQELIKNNPNKFQKAINPFFKISFLNEQLKLQKFKAALIKQDPDVLFIQEYSQVLLQHIKKTDHYHISLDKKHDSFVALNTKSFPKDEDSQQIKTSLQKLHKWFESTAIIVSNKVIFISVHLSSKVQLNNVQVASLKQGIKIIQQKYPEHHFVMAGDLNSFVTFEQPINYYPMDKNQSTTSKKRTASQAQIHKAENEVKESKDKIISNLTLKAQKITFLNGKQAESKGFLPTNEHPHDHFLVQAKISLRKQS